MGTVSLLKFNTDGKRSSLQVVQCIKWLLIDGWSELIDWNGRVDGVEVVL